MISFRNFITEKTLNPMPYDRFMKYGKAVIDDIANGIAIKTIYDTTVVFDRTDAEKLQAIYDSGDINALKAFRFSGNGYRWTQIFKGVYSKHIGGNKGNKFEAVSYVDIQNYIKDGLSASKPYVKEIVDLVHRKHNGYNITGISHDGGRNTKREVDIGSQGIPTIAHATGADITDLTLICEDVQDKDQKVFLSLKYGNTVSFINAGLKNIFKDKEMIECATTGDISKLNQKALHFCKFLKLDPLKVCTAFTEYTPEKAAEWKLKNKNKINNRDLSSTKETIEYELDGEFKNFMVNVIGYDYILVHAFDESRNCVEVRDMTEKAVRALVNGKTNVTIYWPTEGNKKRIDIIFTLKDEKSQPTLRIQLEIRNTSGKVFPDKLLANYKFLK